MCGEVSSTVRLLWAAAFAVRDWSSGEVNGGLIWEMKMLKMVKREGEVRYGVGGCAVK